MYLYLSLYMYTSLLSLSLLTYIYIYIYLSTHIYIYFYVCVVCVFTRAKALLQGAQCAHICPCWGVSSQALSDVAKHSPELAQLVVDAGATSLMVKDLAAGVVTAGSLPKVMAGWDLFFSLGNGRSPGVFFGYGSLL